MGTLNFQDLRGPEASPLLPAIAGLRIQVFQEFPYLYKGSLEYENNYLATYFRCPDALIVVCTDEDKVVGASTAVPLIAEDSALQQPFLNAGMDPAKIMYFGESVLLPAYRGRGIGKIFFHHRLQYAARSQGIEWAAFCAVIRSPDDSRRPADYRPLDGLWQTFGFKKKDGLLGRLSWQELGEEKETAKAMQFWLRPIVPIRSWDSSTQSTSL